MANTSIYRNIASTGNSDICTISCWFKKDFTGVEKALFGGWRSSTDRFQIRFKSDDTIDVEFGYSGSWYSLITNRKFRDPSAWMHLVLAIDSTQGTPANREKLYINGVQETSFSTEVYMPQNNDTLMTTSGDEVMVGSSNQTSGSGTHQGFWKGCMSHVQFVDGLALAPTVFGETDSTDGMWKIITTAYGTPGTNGFFLKMEDSTNMDLDSSSNALTFTTEGTLTATKDNPSNNFCTLNPLFGKVGITYAFTNGNNVLSTSGGSGWHQAMGTLGAVTGKWYYEAYANYTPGAYNTQLGWGSADYLAQTKAEGGIGAGISKPSFGLYDVGKLYYSTDSSNTQETASWAASWTSGDYLMFAADLDNGRFYVGKNGTWDSTSSSNPAAGTGGYSFTPGGYTYIPMMALYYQDIITNFGNGYFTTTSAGATNADDNGHGVFKYDVPAGFYAICTKNIKEFG